MKKAQRILFRTLGIICWVPFVSLALGLLYVIGYSCGKEVASIDLEKWIDTTVITSILMGIVTSPFLGSYLLRKAKKVKK